MGCCLEVTARRRRGFKSGKDRETISQERKEERGEKKVLKKRKNEVN